VNKQQIATFLQTVQLFHELESDKLHKLAHSAHETRFSAGQLIFDSHEGQAALFVLVEGEGIEYLELGEHRMEVQSRRFYPGDFFGMESIIVPRAPVARITAAETGRAMVLSKDVIEDLFGESKAFAQAVSRALATQLHRMQDMVHGIRFVRLENFPNVKSYMSLLPRRVSSVCRALAVDHLEDRVTVAMVNPTDIRARSFIEDILREYHVQVVAISEDDFEERGRKLLGERIESGATDRPFDKLMYQDIDGALRPLQGSHEDDLLSRLLTIALRRGASDVHFEPFHGRARVRLRVDGRMVMLDEKINAGTYRQVVARIKILSEMDTTRIRRPQDGRFLVQADEHPIEFRVSASPCLGGEKVVLRVIAPTAQFGDLSRLILHTSFERMARELFSSPSGLVLVTGPSGAGKTTTLYAALKSVIGNVSAKNVVTIEDPVEYDLPFATQIQVNPESGMTFANVLKSVLRQDPDVILVGVIRDPESAAMAAEAATTGHLVLSSLHTYSALDAVVRLRDLRVPPYVISAGLQGVVTQQLVPRLEPGFAQEIPLDDPIMQQLVQMGVIEPQWDKPLLRGYESVDGPPSGEAGRVAIYEMLAATPDLSAAIDRSATRKELQECLNPSCCGTFRDYARFLLQEGIVAPERIVDVLPRSLVHAMQALPDVTTTPASQPDLPRSDTAPTFQP